MNNDLHWTILNVEKALLEAASDMNIDYELYKRSRNLEIQSMRNYDSDFSVMPTVSAFKNG